MRNDRIKREKGVPAVNEVIGKSGALRCPARTHPCLPRACGQGRSTWSCPRFICGCAPGSSFLASRLSPAAPPAVAAGCVLQAGDAFPARLAAGIAAGKVVPGAVSRVSPCAAGMLQAGWRFPARTAASVGAAQAVRGHTATAGMCSSCGVVQSPFSPRSDPCGTFCRARGPSKHSAFHALCCCC